MSESALKRRVEQLAHLCSEKDKLIYRLRIDRRMLSNELDRKRKEGPRLPFRGIVK